MTAGLVVGAAIAGALAIVSLRAYPVLGAWTWTLAAAFGFAIAVVLAALAVDQGVPVQVALAGCGAGGIALSVPLRQVALGETVSRRSWLGLLLIVIGGLVIMSGLSRLAEHLGSRPRVGAEVQSSVAGADRLRGGRPRAAAAAPPGGADGGQHRAPGVVRVT